MTTKADIVALLARNDKAIARALVVLNERQTATEQAQGETRNLNGQGFTPADAHMGTSMAVQVEKGRTLSVKQLAYWRKPNVRGVPRIAKYAGQLLEIANAKAAVMQKKMEPVGDVGNMAEEMMVLQEQYAHYQGDGDYAGLELIAEQIALLQKEIARAYMEMEANG